MFSLGKIRDTDLNVSPRIQYIERDSVVGLMSLSSLLLDSEADVGTLAQGLGRRYLCVPSLSTMCIVWSQSPDS